MKFEIYLDKTDDCCIRDRLNISLFNGGNKYTFEASVEKVVGWSFRKVFVLDIL